MSGSGYQKEWSLIISVSALTLMILSQPGNLMVGRFTDPKATATSIVSPSPASEMQTPPTVATPTPLSTPTPRPLSWLCRTLGQGCPPMPSPRP
jgi:hypothetical protein